MHDPQPNIRGALKWTLRSKLAYPLLCATDASGNRTVRTPQRRTRYHYATTPLPYSRIFFIINVFHLQVLYACPGLELSRFLLRSLDGDTGRPLVPLGLVLMALFEADSDDIALQLLTDIYSEHSSKISYCWFCHFYGEFTHFCYW